MSFSETSIEFLKGVGPQRAEVLRKELSIFTYHDLLHYFPFRYVDKSVVTPINELREEMNNALVKGQLIDVKEVGVAKNKRLTALIEDHTGILELVWFKGVKWIKPALEIGKDYLFFGKITRYGTKLNMTHPDMDLVIPEKYYHAVQPVYHSSEKLGAKGLHSKGIEKLQRILTAQYKGRLEETLPDSILKRHRLIGREMAYLEIHFPSNIEMAEKARIRLKFEELFFLQMQLIRLKILNTVKFKGNTFSQVGNIFNEFFHQHMPFELTHAQKRVIKEIRKDLGSGLHMNRLLQGDVGSGKTLVALLCMLLAVDNGFQAAIMAPTEILATQHFNSITDFLSKMDIHVRLLTGSTRQSERSAIHGALRDGFLHILVGTHALLEDEVVFKNLGLVVIDEQHRFGVAQRAKMWKKNIIPPHILVMTATPIPRTLAMTFYGDLDVSVIDEMPPGRKPIKTIHWPESKRGALFHFIEQEIEKGRQVYVVYPLIEESESLDYKDLTDGYESITRRFPLPKFKVSIVHGKMKSADKEIEMQRFAQGETQIMVATTVIEVGVNVPNASVMVIESAEKFGLAQLHQLRGRVGRGAEQSYCVLMTDYKLGEDARTRMETMVRTNDGFEISEVDLKLRGPGDIMGTQQSGMLELKIADLARDGRLIQAARDAAQEILDADPNLEQQQHKTMRDEFIRQSKKRSNWSVIS
ncbi:MAG: ATP-dependent DNA helicase RecG [Flavobacteriales bacterium]